MISKEFLRAGRCSQGIIRGVLTALFVLLVFAHPSFADDFTAHQLGDYGNVTVMEVTGNYDAKNPDGSVNALPRQAITKEFLRLHKDEYDFVVVFTNFGFQMPDSETAGFYEGIKNDTQGLGRALFDYSAQYGSNGRLQGTIDMGNLADKASNPMDAGFEKTLRVLAHEMQHRWGSYVHYQDAAGNKSSALLGKDAEHWSYLLDSKGSVMYGNGWQDNGDGSFTAVSDSNYYSPLDLYLMGMLDKTQVPPMLLIENPSIDPDKFPEPGTTITGTAHYVTIDDIIAAEGERLPNAVDSQKKFKTAFIYAVTPGSFTSDALPGLENIRNGFQVRYSILTDGKGVVQITPTVKEDLAGNPGVSPPSTTVRNLPPSINDGLQWLMNSQLTDGSWTDFNLTTERDTAETVTTLLNFPAAVQSFQAGSTWLGNNASANTDYLTRRIETAAHAGNDSSALVQELIGRRNSDGGWGSGSGFLSNPTDTALALKALALAGYGDRSVVGGAISYLQAHQNTDGGWSDGGPSIIQPTAAVLSAFSAYGKSYPLTANLARAVAFLASKQNVDGGFGNSPSTIYDSSLALQALGGAGADRGIINNGLGYLTGLQGENGSWNDSPYQTALAIRTIWQGSLDADLAIKAEEISFLPEKVTSLPANVVLKAVLWNQGRTDVPKAKVVLYQGSVSAANKIAEQMLAFPGQSSVTVSFALTVNDGNEHAYFVVVDPENLVPESDKTNNSAEKVLLAESTFDFELLPADLTVSPSAASMSQDVAISVKVSNHGTSDAFNVPVRFFIDTPGAPYDIATQNVDLPAGGSVTRTVTWKANRAGVNLPLSVQIDPANGFSETNKNNNKASLPLTVTGSNLPNLTVSYQDIAITPSPARDQGNAHISVTVKNDGAASADNVKVGFYNGVPGKNGALIGSQVIPTIPAGQSATASIDWLNINDSGSKVIFVQVDPENAIPVTSRDNDSAFVTLQIQSLPDLVLTPGSISFTPAAPREGDQLSISVTVQNSGTQDALNVPVELRDNGVLIGTQILPLVRGIDSTVASFTGITATGTGVHAIQASADPGNTIAERSKDNNSATRSFSIQSANLWLSEPYFSPNGDGIKDSTDFFFRLAAATKVRVLVTSAKGVTVRTFSGGELDNTAGSTVTWNGLDDRGSVVSDGSYQIGVLDPNGTVLGSLPVVVDTNRSSLSDAIGTRFLLNTNLSCTLPPLASWSGNSWQWLPDESGIFFNIANNYATPSFPFGDFIMSSAGDDIRAISPAPWSDQVTPSALGSIWENSLSPDGSKVAVLVQTIDATRYPFRYLMNLWSINSDGGNPVHLASFNDYWNGSVQPTWSHDSKKIVFKSWNTDASAFFKIINADGTGGIQVDSVSTYVGKVKWSNDDSKIAFESYDPYGTLTLKTADVTGTAKDVFTSPGYNSYNSSFDWLKDGSLFLKTISGRFTQIWKIDANGTDNNLLIELASPRYGGDADGVLLNDQKTLVAIKDEGDEFDYLKVLDLQTSAISTVYQGEAAANTCSRSLPDLRWSYDGKKLAFIDEKYQVLGDGFYNGYLVTVDTVGGTKKAVLVSQSENFRGSCASFHLKTEENGDWLDRGTLHFDSFYRTKEFDLSQYLKRAKGSYSLRISQVGRDEAHVDAVGLRLDGRVYPPTRAVNLTTNEDILAKITTRDNQVADTHNAEIELTWDKLPAAGNVSVVLNAHELNLARRQVHPFRYPKTGYYPVTLTAGTPLVLDGKIGPDDDLPAPLFKEYSQPITGHPAAFVYGYAKSDGVNLFGVLDFTVDNTLDPDLDWASLEVETKTGTRKFLLTESTQSYGKTSFSVTDKVSYPHKVYEFRIPLEEIGAAPGDSINLSYSAYGSAGGNDELTYYLGEMSWLKDNNTVVGADNRGLFAVDATAGSKAYLPVSGDLVGPSPLGGYLNYFQYADPESTCNAYGGYDLWSLSSALNLTTELSAVKEKSSLLLKGTAADANFGGYRLEYADASLPGVWNLIAPASTTQVLNDTFTSWIPPHPGSYSVRLTAWDQAGNQAIKQQSVSWGLTSSITGLYKSREMFSPILDGANNTVELHYRVLEPVHLEFTVLDGAGNVLRTFLKDHTSPVDDAVSWDGRDAQGRVVADGKYSIKVLDYQFFVSVDATPPEVSLQLGRVRWGAGGYQVDLTGYAKDLSFASWSLEYGEGDNPAQWFALSGSPEPLAPKDNLIKTYSRVSDSMFDHNFKWLAGKKLRLSAEDAAGNKRVVVSSMLEETIVASGIDNYDLVNLNSADSQEPPKYAIPAIVRNNANHVLNGFETVSLSFSGMTVQYRIGTAWQNVASTPKNSSSDPGEFEISFREADLPLQAEAVRIKGTDSAGQDHFSDEYPIVGIFKLLSQDCNVYGMNTRALQSLKVQLSSSTDSRYLNWTDIAVYDAKTPAPIGTFLAVPPDSIITRGLNYSIRMVGVTSSGEILTSNTQSFPLLGCTGSSIAAKLKYVVAGCDSASGKVQISADISKVYLEDPRTIFGKGLMTSLQISLRETAAGPFKQLASFDFSRGIPEDASVNLDTSYLAEGTYPVKVELGYRDRLTGQDEALTDTATLVVDRVLPTARLTYPAGNALAVCPVKATSGKGDWFAIPVEALAADNTGVKSYTLFYGAGEFPENWLPATTRKSDGSPVPIAGTKEVAGSLAPWDITGLTGTSYSLKLVVSDTAGNVRCTTTSFSINQPVDVGSLTTDRAVFSPNGDGALDLVTAIYRIDQDAIVDVKVFKLLGDNVAGYNLDAAPLRTLVSGAQHLSGSETAVWDGFDDAGTPVPDGLYAVAVFATNPCGSTKVKWARVTVDNTPPALAISYPKVGDQLPAGNIIEVKGSALDPHFGSYRFEAGEGSDPTSWTTVASSTLPLQDNILAGWNSFGKTGTWTLRLSSMDAVGNNSSTAVTLDLGQRKTLIKTFEAASRFISPNNDGRLDSATFSATITDNCQVKAEIANDSGALVRTLPLGTQGAGSINFSWDGKGDSGIPVDDGSYSVSFSAALSSNPLLTQTEKMTVTVDTTRPRIEIKQPADKAYLNLSRISVAGAVNDLNLGSYALTVSGPAGQLLQETENQNVTDHSFGMLEDLAEGDYTVTGEARDLAENAARVVTAFSIDRTPPKVTLDAWKAGAYFGNLKNIVAITGAIAERNLDHYSLRFGAGDAPQQWSELAGGTTVPGTGPLYQWKVGKADNLDDGIYTLSLYAKDKAGLEGEAKLRLTVDNTPPTVAFASLRDGDYLRGPLDLQGTLADANLDKGALELAEGPCSTAVKWTALKNFSTALGDGILESWKILPADGDYCLRLSALDKSGNSAESKVNLKIDTHPPAAPLLTGKTDNRTDGDLSWSKNGEPDLAGYNLYRDGVKLNGAPLVAVSFTDSGLKEGSYSYTVKALDLAGNESQPSNAVKLTVDLTGPSVRIGSPQDGGVASGLIDIKGSAFSEDDFKEYRVFVGAGSSPAAWNLLRKSPVPLPYGTLAQWDSTGQAEGSYTVRIEAEDTSGNVTVRQAVFSVDNSPPAAPLLISATASGSDVSLVWQGHGEADLAGYLLYRNGQLANVSGVVVGNLKPYLVAGSSYTDRGVPDGKYTYYLVAMDQAGNAGAASNTLVAEIDVRRPHAVITEPVAGTKFELKTTVRAECPDNDVVSLQFRFKGTQDSAWTDLGAPVGTAPFVASFDPKGLGLAYGDYQLTAVASDQTGADPAPASVAVTYFDLTPPNAPQSLQARTSGNNVSLSWSVNSASDLAGYNLFRVDAQSRTKLNEVTIKETTFSDTALPDGNFDYQVTAVDLNGNESTPSDKVTARIFAPLVLQPFTPTANPALKLSGSGAGGGAFVTIVKDNAAGSAAFGPLTADALGAFNADLGNLVLGENRFSATATDALGNVSRASDPIVVVYNDTPSQPTGLSIDAPAYDALLSWNPNQESDLAGYNVYRDGTKLNAAQQLTSGDISTSTTDYDDYQSDPYHALDGDPTSYWSSAKGAGTFEPQWWEVDFPAAKLISHLEISWGSQPDSQGKEIVYAGKSFEVQAWSGYAWIPVATVANNGDKKSVFELRPSYRTDKLRVYLTDTTDSSDSKQVRINEVVIMEDSLVSEAAYPDLARPDGVYGYRVSAVDQLGFESAPSDPVQVTVGDIIPPAVPAPPAVSVDQANVALDWSPTANSEPDLAGYHIYRSSGADWTKLTTAALAGNRYLDSNLHNGSYSYRITAQDLTGNESAPSAAVAVSVAVTPPQQAPGNLVVVPLPEGGKLKLTWEPAGGTATAYFLYRGTTAGGPYQRITANPLPALGYLDVGLVNGTAYYYLVRGADAGSNEGPASGEVTATPADLVAPAKPAISFPVPGGGRTTVYRGTTGVAGTAEPGASVELVKDGQSVGKTVAFATDTTQKTPIRYDLSSAVLSPTGDQVAYYDPDSWALMVRDLSSGATATILANGWSPVWSPAGDKIAYQYSGQWGDRVGIYDLATATSTPLTDGQNSSEQSPSWSGNGSRIAYARSGDTGNSIWVKDLITGSENPTNLRGDSPVISPDGEKVAYTVDGNLSVSNLGDGTYMVVDGNNYWNVLAWSPDSSRLLFESLRTGNPELYITDTASQAQVQLTNSGTYKFSPVWSPDGQQIVFESNEDDGTNAAWMTDLESRTRLLANVGYSWILDWEKSGNVVYFNQNDGNLTVVHPQGQYVFNGVTLAPGENIFTAVATDGAGQAGPPSDAISVVFDTALLPDVAVSSNDIFLYPEFPKPGDQVSVDAVVSNSSPTPVDNVEVDVYLWDASGNLQLVKSATIVHLDGNSAEDVAFEVPAGWQAGTQSVIVVADPAGKLTERQKSNNSATREFHIATAPEFAVATVLDAAQYTSGQSATVTVTLVNSGDNRDGVLAVSIEDQAGARVSLLESRPGPVLYGTNSYSYQWNCGATFAGSYRAHAVFTGTDGAVTESSAAFSILPDLRVAASVVTDKKVYGAHENTDLALTIKNGGSNYLVSQLTVKLKLVNAGGAVVFTDEKQLQNLFPNSAASLSSSWNTGLSAPGTYSAIVEAYIGEALASSSSASFSVTAVSALSGTLSVAPAAVPVSAPFRAVFTVSNSGNAPSNGVLQADVVDPDTGASVATAQQALNLPMGGSLSGEFSFQSQGLQLKRYLVSLQFTSQGEQKNLASTGVTLKDITAPLLTVLAPAAGTAYTGDVSLSAIASDDASGVDNVEWQLDGGDWKPLPLADPSSGRYAAAWTPGAADQGTHSIRFRATDRSKNASAPVAVTFSWGSATDTMGPVLTVSTLSDGSYTNNDILNIAGTVSDDTAVKALQVNGADVVVNADGSFSYALPLLSGANTVSVTATDLAGNQSKNDRTIILDQTAPTLQVDTPADNSKTAAALIQLSGIVEENSTLVSRVNGVVLPVTRDGSAYAATVPLEYGLNTIEITATDLAGNESTRKRTVIYDNQVPALSVTDPGQDSRTNAATLTIRGTASDALTGVTVTVSSEGRVFTPALVNGTFSQDLSFSEEKAYPISVTATNEAGTATTVQRTIVYDVTPPALGIDPVVTPSNLTFQAVSGTREAGAVVTVSCTTALTATVLYPTATTWSVALTALTSGDNDIVVTATDAAGNSTTQTARVTVDTESPIGSLTINNGCSSTNSLQVSLSLSAADSGGVSQMSFSSDALNWTLPEVFAPLRVWYLAPGDGAKQLFVQFKDTAGNWSAAYGAGITLDSTAPTVTATPAGGIYGAEQRVILSANEAATIYYTSDGSIPTLASAVYLGPIAVVSNATLKYFARDLAGNLGEVKSANYLIDTVPPFLAVSTLEDGSYTNHDTLNVAGTVQDANGVTSLLINGVSVPVHSDGSFSQALVLSSGANPVTITATDLAGNQSENVRTVYLDQTAPDLTIATPADNSKTGLALIPVNGTVEENSTVQIKVNGQNQAVLRDGLGFSATVTLAAGLNTIELTATDLAGNERTQKRTVIYDNLAPSLAVTDPTQDIRTNQGTHTIRGTASDPWSSVGVAITSDGVTYTPAVTNGVFEQALSFPTEKTYPIIVTATNEVGNTSRVQRNIIYDITPPALTINAVSSPTTLTSQSLTGTREAGTTVSVTCATASVGAVAYPGDTTWSISVSNLQAGDNLIVATASDAAGNVGSASAKITFASSTHAPLFSYALFGSQGVTLAGGSYADSYLGAVSTWLRSQYKNGDVGTNATQPCSIQLTNNAQIYGKTWVGAGANPASAICLSGGSVIYNNRTGALTAALDMTPMAEPPGGTSMGALNLSNGVSSTLGAGAYRYSSLNLTGGSTLTLNGPVVLHVAGNLTISNGSRMVVNSGSATLYVNGQKIDITGGSFVNATLDPRNLTIYGGSGLQTVNLSGAATLHAQVFAPAGAIVVSGGQSTFGSLIGRTINLSNGSSVHFDENP
jgi:large repetitive protein